MEYPPDPHPIAAFERICMPQSKRLQLKFRPKWRNLWHGFPKPKPKPKPPVATCLYVRLSMCVGQNLAYFHVTAFPTRAPTSRSQHFRLSNFSYCNWVWFGGRTWSMGMGRMEGNTHTTHFPNPGSTSKPFDTWAKSGKVSPRQKIIADCLIDPMGQTFDGIRKW